MTIEEKNKLLIKQLGEATARHAEIMQPENDLDSWNQEQDRIFGDLYQSAKFLTKQEFVMAARILFEITTIQDNVSIANLNERCADKENLH